SLHHKAMELIISHVNEPNTYYSNLEDVLNTFLLNNKQGTTVEAYKFADFSKDDDIEDFLEGRKYNSAKFGELFFALYKLNTNGFLIKEQCFNIEQLFGLRKEVNNVVDLIKRSKSQEIIKSACENLCSEDNKNKMGYFSAYYLAMSLTQDVASKISFFTTNIDKNTNNINTYSKWLNKLVKYIKYSVEICSNWEEKVNNKVVSNQNFLCVINEDDYFGAYESAYESNLDVLWKELNWSPKDLSDQIYALNGKSCTHIVECSLVSEPNKVLYIRSNNPILSSDKSINKGHVKKYKFDFHDVVSGDGGIEVTQEPQNQTSVKRYEYKGVALDDFAHQFTSYSFTKDVPYFQQWNEYYAPKTGKVNVFGIEGRYDMSMAAQFMRFSFQNETALTFGFADGKPSNGFVSEFKNESKTGINIASAQASVTYSFPESGNGFEFKLPYVEKYLDENNNWQEKSAQAPMGNFGLIITGQVYGAVAASLQMCGSIDVGNSATGLFGIKGTQDTEDANRYQVSESNDEKNIAKIEGKAFAGVEVGGLLKCSLMWLPPYVKEGTKPICLSSIQGGLRATLGFSGMGLSITFTQSKFIWHCQPMPTWGLGISGKISGEIDYKALDHLFYLLVSLTQSRRFKRFEFIDEKDDETFKMINKTLTIMIAYHLEASEVLLLPVKMISKLFSKSITHKNAYSIANFINDKSNVSGEREWLKNALPETFAKLLHALVKYNEITFLNFTDSQQLLNKDNSLKNISQSQAILTILEWMGASNPNGPSDQQIKNFENAIQRMGSFDGQEFNKTEQWIRYKNNLLKIREFFRLCSSKKYENEYDRIMHINYNNFSTMITRLTIKHGLFYLYQPNLDHTSGGFSVGKRDTVVLDTKHEKTSKYKEIVWNGDIEYDYHNY
ncbi:hypothetical protein, partial [Vibrio eleionomae]|uniref:hypothetical protein n=1 Tax=Vibrio eleionomae TaxID=2653505 RepID=UPI00136D5FC0